MSKLLFFVDQDHPFAPGGTGHFVCRPRDELDPADHIGEQVLIANVGSRHAGGIVALGRLDHWSGHEGLARVSAIQPFPTPVQLPLDNASSPAIFEISDAAFGEVIDRAVGNQLDERVETFWSATAPLTPFTEPLAARQQHRCAFSALPTEHGAAFAIRPLDQGGQWHIANFLFLDPEPGEAFARFAWTVGPRFEIVIDTYALGADIADTVTRTGVLLVPELEANWPDRAALAWHFEQFTRRLGSERR